MFPHPKPISPPADAPFAEMKCLALPSWAQIFVPVPEQQVMWKTNKCHFKSRTSVQSMKEASNPRGNRGTPLINIISYKRNACTCVVFIVLFWHHLITILKHLSWGDPWQHIWNIKSISVFFQKSFVPFSLCFYNMLMTGALKMHKNLNYELLLIGI